MKYAISLLCADKGKFQSPVNIDACQLDWHQIIDLKAVAWRIKAEAKNLQRFSQTVFWNCKSYVTKLDAHFESNWTQEIYKYYKL